MLYFVVGDFVEAVFTRFVSGCVGPKAICYFYWLSTSAVIVVCWGWLFFLKNCKLKLRIAGRPMVSFEHEKDTFEDQFGEFDTVLPCQLFEISDEPPLRLIFSANMQIVFNIRISLPSHP